MSNNAIEQDINTYLQQLADALAGQDAALVQDAKYDAESHFRAALEDASLTAKPMPDIISNYGSAKEIARHYADMEATVNWALHGGREPGSIGMPSSVWAILSDMAAYKAVLYFFLSLPLALVYIAWTLLVGVSSAGASILLIGLPIFLFFINSMHHFSLFEGRIIETLLEKRMPRRPVYRRKKPTSFSFTTIKHLLQYRQHWTTALYLMLQLPLACLYLAIIVLPALLSVAVFFSPIVDPIVHSLNPAQDIDINWYWFPVTAPLSITGLMLVLHAAKAVGRQHARFAKSMLVST
jgi:hypothetical protein